MNVLDDPFRHRQAWLEESKRVMGGGSVTIAARDGRWETRGGVCDQVRRHRLWAVYGYERLEWVMTLEGQPVRGHEINGVVAEMGQTWRRLGRSILCDVHHVVH